MRKDTVDLSVYITDAKGIVLFESDGYPQQDFDAAFLCVSVVLP